MNHCYIPLGFFGGFDEVLGIFLGPLGGLCGVSQGDCLRFVLSSFGGLGGGSLGGSLRFVGGFQMILLSRWVISLQVKNSSSWLSLLQAEEKIDEHFLGFETLKSKSPFLYFLLPSKILIFSKDFEKCITGSLSQENCFVVLVLFNTVKTLNPKS